MNPRIVFITGTDTGVGKTLLTALLLRHLRAQGSHALALKPFCSGTCADAQLLHDLQDRDLTLAEINPFYFPEPVAPIVSARKHNQHIALDQVLRHITSIARRFDQDPRRSDGRLPTRHSPLVTPNYLLIEGSGGLLVPLGEGYTVRDLIARLNGEVIVVSRNRLGTINHTLLTIHALLNPSPRRSEAKAGPHSARSALRTFRTAHSAFRIPHSALKVVLMDPRAPDVSCSSNAAILSELLAPTPFFRLAFLGSRACSPQGVKKHAHKIKKVLARILS